MTFDLFAETTIEAFEERAAIREFDGLITRERAEELAALEAERWREACEVRYVIWLNSRQERNDYLAAVRIKRGAEAADRLKSLVEKDFVAERARANETMRQ